MNEEHRFKTKLFHTLEPYGENNRAGRWFDWFLIILIIANVMAAMAETVPELKTRYGSQFFWFEALSVAIFSVEYVARIWVCTLERQPDTSRYSSIKYRIRFLMRPVSVIDLLAILPFYLGMFVSVDLRALRLLRMTQMLKLGRYSNSVQTLNRVIANEYRVLIAALAIMMMIMVIAATAMYYLERHAQPEFFGSIPQALWWSVITLSTVGYGDVAPVTTLGRFFSGVFILVGVAIFAIPAGILASSFSEQMSQKRDKFRKRILEMFASGKMVIKNPDDFEYMRKRLGLTHEEAELLSMGSENGKRSD